MKTVVNAFSLIKRPCGLVPLQIIKVSDMKLNFGRILIQLISVMLSTHVTWSSMGVSIRGFTTILLRKCKMGQFLQSYPKRAFANPMVLFCTTCWPRDKLILLLLKLWNGSLQKSSTRKNATNRVILSQLARLQHNRVNTPLLQNNIGKIIIFQYLKKFGSSQNNHFAF